MNPFKVLMWLCETFHIETLGQLAVVLAALDLVVHFVASGLAACGASILMRQGFCLLYWPVGGSPGRTTLEGRIISLFSLSVALFVSSWVHCARDFGWHGLLRQLNGVLW